MYLDIIRKKHISVYVYHSVCGQVQFWLKNCFKSVTWTINVVMFVMVYLFETCIFILIGREDIMLSVVEGILHGSIYWNVI